MGPITSHRPWKSEIPLSYSVEAHFLLFLLPAACLNLALLLFMVVWEPNPEYPVIFFTLLGVWGVGDGIWVSQTNSIVSALFPDKLEDAFASLRVLQGLGATIVFCYSNSLCVMEKMYILAAVCIIGTALYIGVELTEKKKMTKKGEVNTPWIKSFL